MELSIVVAKMVSLVYLSAGVAALVGRLNFSDMIEEFERSSALTFVTGFLSLICGVLLVEYHNIWVKDWVVLITVIGWAALLKGVVLIAFPRVIVSCKNWYRNSRAWGALMLAVGVIVGYFGFIARAA